MVTLETPQLAGQSITIENNHLFLFIYYHSYIRSVEHNNTGALNFGVSNLGWIHHQAADKRKRGNWSEEENRAKIRELPGLRQNSGLQMRVTQKLSERICPRDRLTYENKSTKDVETKYNSSHLWSVQKRTWTMKTLIRLCFRRVNEKFQYCIIQICIFHSFRLWYIHFSTPELLVCNFWNWRTWRFIDWNASSCSISCFWCIYISNILAYFYKIFLM